MGLSACKKEKERKTSLCNLLCAFIYMVLIIIDLFITRRKEKKDHEVLVIYFTISLERNYDMG